MSMRDSITYLYWGPFDFHRYLHAAQPWREQSNPRTRVVFYDIGIGRWSFQVWPWNMTYQNNPWWKPNKGPQ